MNFKQNSGRSDPQDVARSVLEEARQQIEIANELRQRINEQLSKSRPDATRHPPQLQRALPPHRSWPGKLALGGLIGLLVVVCIGAAAMVLLLRDDAAKLATARWGPQLHRVSSPAAERPVPAQSNQSPVKASASKEASSQPAVLAPQTQILLAGSTPTAAVPSNEREEKLQSMARGLVAVVVEQEMEQLKASIEKLKASQEAVAAQLRAAQEQAARDNAAITEQLKASQEQVARLIAKASEPQLRPRTPAPPARPIATPTDRPGPLPLSPQARAQAPVAPVRGRLQ